MNPKRDANEPPTCPRCHGPMPSPISVTELQPNGIPRSTYVCRHCHREWVRGRGRFQTKQLQEES